MYNNILTILTIMKKLVNAALAAAIGVIIVMSIHIFQCEKQNKRLAKRLAKKEIVINDLTEKLNENGDNNEFSEIRLTCYGGLEK